MADDVGPDYFVGIQATIGYDDCQTGLGTGRKFVGAGYRR